MFKSYNNIAWGISWGIISALAVLAVFASWLNYSIN